MLCLYVDKMSSFLALPSVSNLPSKKITGVEEEEAVNQRKNVAGVQRVIWHNIIHVEIGVLQVYKQKYVTQTRLT